MIALDYLQSPGWKNTILRTLHSVQFFSVIATNSITNKSPVEACWSSSRFINDVNLHDACPCSIHNCLSKVESRYTEQVKRACTGGIHFAPYFLNLKLRMW